MVGFFFGQEGPSGANAHERGKNVMGPRAPGQKQAWGFNGRDGIAKEAVLEEGGENRCGKFGGIRKRRVEGGGPKRGAGGLVRG